MTITKATYNWQKELPNKEGDWLFIILWECGCCAIDQGFVMVLKEEDPEGRAELIENRFIPLENDLLLSWEPYPKTWNYLKDKKGSVTIEDMDITAWMPIEYPPKEFSQTLLPLRG